jgi:hypothetical protein
LSKNEKIKFNSFNECSWREEMRRFIFALKIFTVLIISIMSTECGAKCQINFPIPIPHAHKYTYNSHSCRYSQRKPFAQTDDYFHVKIRNIFPVRVNECGSEVERNCNISIWWLMIVGAVTTRPIATRWVRKKVVERKKDWKI